MRHYTKEHIEAASRIWGVLVWAAKKRQRPLTYKELSPLVGVYHRHFAHPLAIITLYCRKNDLPALAILAVKTEDGKPGRGLSYIKDPAKETDRVYEFVEEQWDIFWNDRKWTKNESKIINPGVNNFWRFLPEDRRPAMDF